MPGSFLLDTTAAIALLNEDPTFLAWLPDDGEIFLGPTTLGELHYGALRSARNDENLARVASLRSVVPLLDLDEARSFVYAIVKNELRSKGTPIPENDLWIAATAMRHGVTLVARDRHFETVEALSVEAW